MLNDIKNHIKEWIQKISVKQPALDGYAVCPYAKNAEYEVYESKGYDIDPPPWEFELIIYAMPDNLSFDSLDAIATEYNKLYPELVFLPDGKDRHTEINGVETSNGKYNLLLCQNRKKLQDARERLANTPYYSFWNEEYLKEILNQ